MEACYDWCIPLIRSYEPMIPMIDDLSFSVIEHARPLKGSADFLATATAADPKSDLWRIRWQTWHKRVAIVIGTFGDVCRLYIGFVSWIGMNSRVPGVWMCVCVWMPRPWNFIWLDRCVCVVCLWLVLLIRVFVVIFGRFCWSVWEPTVVETFNRSARIDGQITSTTARKAAAIGTCVILIVSYCFC